MQITPVILSGGSGTRLWPLSRKECPKQYLPLVGDNTMLQETILRLERLDNLADPIIICNADHRFLVAEQCQHGADFRSVMPTNLYGINDNFHPENSHVIPALMQRFQQAKVNNDVEVVVWGSGNAMREFLYVDDMAQASLFVLELDEEVYNANTQLMLSHINVGTGKDTTIREMAETMKQVVGFKGKLIFDETKLDGAPRKLIDITRLENMGWKYSVDLEGGLKETYNWYLNE
jgi:GDP-L-fucose synthase